MNKVDKTIGHVTEAGANLFEELGFPPDEAKRLQAQSRREIEAVRDLMEQMMVELGDWVFSSGMSHEECAERLMIAPEQLLDIVNRKSGEFSLAASIDLMIRTGRPVKITLA